MGKYKVARVGWDNENRVAPIILVDRKERNKLGISKGCLVNVKHNANSTQAIVEVQFRDLIKSKKATVSNQLSMLLDCIEGDTIEITGACSAAEKKAFVQHIHEQFGISMPGIDGAGIDRQRQNIPLPPQAQGNRPTGVIITGVKPIL